MISIHKVYDISIRFGSSRLFRYTIAARNNAEIGKVIFRGICKLCPVLICESITFWLGDGVLVQIRTYFTNHRDINAKLETGDMSSNYVLLGDTFYYNANIPQTPLVEVNTSDENLYKKRLTRTGNIAERCFGVSKRLFLVLSSGMCLCIASNRHCHCT